jgi:hypothetical protein
LIDSKANFDYEKIETNFPAVCKHLQSLNLPKTARLTTAIEREAAMAWDRRRAGGKATDEHQERQVAGAKPDLAGDRGTGMGKRNRKQRKYTPRLTPIQIQVYERIRHEHLPRSNYADTVERLMEDNAFLEQFREAEFKGGQKLTRKFVRKAIAYFDMRNRRTNNQQTKLL